MPVISRLKDSQGNDITKYNKSTISKITMGGINYHFARKAEASGTCEDAVPEPIINLKIEGNSIQEGIPTPESPVEIQSVGERTKNLLPYPYLNTTKTTNGITYTDNGDGGITVSGTSTGYPMFELAKSANLKLEVGKIYSFKLFGTYSNLTLNVAYKDDTGTRKYASAEIEWKEGYSDLIIYLQVNPNFTASGTVYPYFVEYALKDTEYEPYGYKIPIKIQADNLFDYSILEQYYIVDDINNIIVKQNNTLGWASMKYLQLKPLTTYTLTIGNTTKLDLRTPDYNIKLYQGTGTTTTFITDDTGKVCFKFFSPDDVYPHNIGFIQLEQGSSTTYPITHDIYLKEPLRKIGDYVDYIDYKNKKVVHNIKAFELKGTEAYGLGSTNDVSQKRIYITIIGAKNVEYNVLSTLCTHYKASIPVETYQCVTGCSGYDNQNVCAIFDENHQTVEGFNAFTKEQYDNGTPVIIYSLLETPTEETIEIPKILLEKGLNNITIATSVEANIQATYWKQI